MSLLLLFLFSLWLLFGLLLDDFSQTFPAMLLRLVGTADTAGDCEKKQAQAQPPGGKRGRGDERVDKGYGGEIGISPHLSGRDNATSGVH